MTDPTSAPPPTPPPTDPPRRAGTILARLARAVRAQNWAAVAIELAIVVVGVALGLQANRWNEARTAERDVRALVQNLRGEFASNRASLAATRSDLDAIMGASGRVLALVGRQEIGMADTGLDSLIEFTFFWPTWTPSSAASQELVGSGKLSVLADDGLKPLLFEWARHMRQVDEGNRRMERSSQDLIDYVKENGSLRNTNHGRIGVERSPLAVSNRPLLGDPRFENYVAEKLVMAQFLAFQYRQADDLIDRILQEAEVAGADRAAPPRDAP
ncbi:hypothetical protein [Rubrivirga sp. IMCC43871]|uniref:hypothetical protein n=1 Tax=Rubrivirga sp. IMCC43871 TaxID=3391575 RepID=UPI0039902F04